MSCYLIEYEKGAKRMRPVKNKEEYLQLRSLAVHKEYVSRVRQGDTDMKRRLLQFNYSCIPGEDGKLKGCKTPSMTVGMDIDKPQTPQAPLLRGDVPSEQGDLEGPHWFEDVKQKILSKKDELGLLMMERSATKGYHIVFRRHEDMSQEENLRWASDLLGVEFDKAAKDITRVFFATTASSEDLLFLDDSLFENEIADFVNEKLKIKNEESAPLVEDKNVQSISTPLPIASAEGKGEASLCDAGKGAVGEGAVLPYRLILPAFFQMECSSYPDVPEGTRNDTIFNVTAKYLRYCTDHSFARIKALLYPDYAFGLSESEMDSIITSALSRERSYTPKAVKHVLKKFGNSLPSPCGRGAGGEAGEGSDLGSPYRPLDLCIIDEVSLPQLPRWLNILLKVAPPGYRFITLAAVAPAMMTLLTDVSVRFGRKKQTRLNGWTHVDGPPASNKSICLSPIPYLMKPLQDEDDRNQAREDEYFQKKEEATNKKEQPKPPKDIVIRILPANTSRLEHIKRMADAKGKHTYTSCEEIQSLNMTSGSQFHNRSDFMQLLFDNGMTGNQSFVQSSIRVRCPVCWNLSTSGTRDQTLRTFKNATNGAITRVFFCLVPDNTGAPMPEYVQYTESDIACLARAGSIMMQMNGLVLSPKIDRALNEWVEKIRRESLGDNERLILKNRSADIAHHFAVTIHLAWIVQQIMDIEDREQRHVEVRDLDLNQYTERQSVVDMAVYAADQCLDGQYRLWARKMKSQLEAAYEGTAVFKKSDADFIELPDEFTYDTLQGIFPEKKITTIRKMVERLKAAGKIDCVGTHEDTGAKLFRKRKN